MNESDLTPEMCVVSNIAKKQGMLHICLIQSILPCHDNQHLKKKLLSYQADNEELFSRIAAIEDSR